MRPFAKDLIFVFFFIIINLQSAEVAAFDGEIQVVQITPSLDQDSLKVSAKFINLFSNKIVGTIQSGLPSIIQIEIKLLTKNKNSILHKRFAWSVQYDIWEERYSVKTRDSTETYTEFDTVKNRCSMLENVSLIRTDFLNNLLKYAIQIRVGIVPISSRQAEKVTDWLMNPNQTEEVLAAQDRESGFRLNMNKLVSFFIGRKKSRYWSEWHSSGGFILSDLKE